MSTMSLTARTFSYLHSYSYLQSVQSPPTPKLGCSFSETTYYTLLLLQGSVSAVFGLYPLSLGNFSHIHGFYQHYKVVTSKSAPQSTSSPEIPILIPLAHLKCNMVKIGLFPVPNCFSSSYCYIVVLPPSV